MGESAMECTLTPLSVLELPTLYPLSMLESTLLLSVVWVFPLSTPTCTPTCTPTYSGLNHVYGKREAEAEPEANHHFYSNLYHPYTTYTGVRNVVPAVYYS